MKGQCGKWRFEPSRSHQGFVCSMAEQPTSNLGGCGFDSHRSLCWSAVFFCYRGFVAWMWRVELSPSSKGNPVSGFKNINIERYPEDSAVSHGYSAAVEGEDNGGNRWIMWLDQQGRPEVFWPQREVDGAVIGNAIKLDRAPGQFSGVFEMLGVSDDADADEKQPEVVGCFPVWDESEPENITDGLVGMRGVVFAVVPGEGDINERMRRFIGALGVGFGFTSPRDRARRMRHILDSGDPEFVVKRLRESLEGIQRLDIDPDVAEAVRSIHDRRTTQEAKVIPVADASPASD